MSITKARAVKFQAPGEPIETLSGTGSLYINTTGGQRMCVFSVDAKIQDTGPLNGVPSQVFSGCVWHALRCVSVDQLAR
jgi:hypothetical protein